MDAWKVSVYIPCYNSETTLPLCIEGLLNQSRKPDEIIVVDDGSTDKSLTMACRYPVKIVRHQFNLGLAAARNTGLREAQHELVGSLDADTIPHEKWLETLLNYFKFPNIGMICGKLVETIDQTLADKWRAAHMKQHFGDAVRKNPPFIFGNNNIVRKSAAIEVGWYSERFRTNAEDSDLSIRIRWRGYDLMYDPQAIVFHRRGDTIRSILRTGWKWNCYAYDSPVTLKNTLRAAVKQHIPHIFSMMKKDWKARRYRMALFDFLYYFSAVFRDFRMWFGVRFFGKKPF